MPDLVTIEQAREHSRLFSDSEGGPDDAWLAIFIPVVSEQVALWLKDAWRLYEVEVDENGDELLDSQDEPTSVVDSQGDRIVRRIVKGAALVQLEFLYKNRGAADEVELPDAAGHGYVLCNNATAMLTPLRRPSIG